MVIKQLLGCFTGCPFISLGFTKASAVKMNYYLKMLYTRHRGSFSRSEHTIVYCEGHEDKSSDKDIVSFAYIDVCVGRYLSAIYLLLS